MAIFRLPPLLVAMGSAVYAGYLAALDESLYRTPSAGFEGRMAVLFALNGLVIVLGIAYLVLLTLEYRRKGRAWWWFRLVQRPSGRYIASNQGAFAALLGIVSTVVIIGHLREEFNLYLYKSPQNHIAAWRSYSWIPLFVNGWIVSWASLQSYLLTPDQHNRTLLSATVANSLYVGGGVAMTVALFIGSGFSSIAGNDVWRKYVDLRTLLLGLESGSTPPSSSDTLALSSGYQDLLSAAERYRTASIALGILLAVSPFLTVLVNTGSLGLARVLRKQIKRSLRTFRRPSATDSIVPHLSTKNEADGMLRPDDMGTVPSRAEIRQIATLQASGFEGEQAKKIMLLQRAEMDLTVVGGLIFSLSLLFGIITIWIEVRVDSNTLNGASWPTIETALFLVEWIYAIVLSVALLFLIYNAYNHLAATSTVETVQSVFVGASNSIASFQGMFRRQDIPESSATSSHFPGPTRGNPFPTNFSNSRRSGGGGGNNAFPPPPSSSSFARFDSAKSMNQGRMLKVEEGNEMDKVNFEQNFSTSPRPSLT